MSGGSRQAPTEAQVWTLKDEAQTTLQDGPSELRDTAVQVIALCDSWLAQRDVVAAALDLQKICSRAGLGAAVASTPEKFRLDEALAAVVSGTPPNEGTNE